MLSLLRSTFDSGLDVDVEANEDYGIVIVHERGASKTTGVRRLAAVLSDIRFVMIGDGDADRKGRRGRTVVATFL